MGKLGWQVPMDDNSIKMQTEINTKPGSPCPTLHEGKGTPSALGTHYWRVSTTAGGRAHV